LGQQRFPGIYVVPLMHRGVLRGHVEVTHAPLQW
jgi:hypothetical protein